MSVITSFPIYNSLITSNKKYSKKEKEKIVLKINEVLKTEEQNEHLYVICRIYQLQKEGIKCVGNNPFSAKSLKNGNSGKIDLEFNILNLPDELIEKIELFLNFIERM